MIKNINTIDQSGIKSLLKERLDAPDRYVGRPLIIWRSDIRDGIQERVLTEVFNEFNNYRPFKAWYKIASVRQMPHTKTDLLHDMLSAKFVDRNNNRPYEPIHGTVGGKEDVCHNALLVIDPASAVRDYRRNPESLEKYRSVINDRRWDSIKIADGLPMVAYMCIDYEWFETPDAYPDAEQYVFAPDLEEWAQWAVEKAEMPEEVIDFIRGDGDVNGISYRWYNRFNRPGEPCCSGCEYPADWTRCSLRVVPWKMITECAKKEFVDAAPTANLDLLKKKFASKIPLDILERLSRYLILRNT